MRVYKFLSAHWAMEAIVKRHLKISLFQALNDPWDGHAVTYQSEQEKRSWLKALGSLGQSRGMICCSKTWSDPVLWSHYADQHKGIALGFETKVDALPVIYQESLIPFPNKFLTLEYEEKLQFVQRVLSTKFTHWQYESEVRFFTGLEEPDSANGHFFLGFGSEFSLKEIIFGSRYNDPANEAVILSIARKMSGVECIKSRLGHKRFLIERDETWEFRRE